MDQFSVYDVNFISDSCDFTNLLALMLKTAELSRPPTCSDPHSSCEYANIWPTKVQGAECLNKQTRAPSNTGWSNKQQLRKAKSPTLLSSMT